MSQARKAKRAASRAAEDKGERVCILYGLWRVPGASGGYSTVRVELPESTVRRHLLDVDIPPADVLPIATARMLDMIERDVLDL